MRRDRDRLDEWNRRIDPMAAETDIAFEPALAFERQPVD
jgi:hypothetical protein